METIHIEILNIAVDKVKTYQQMTVTYKTPEGKLDSKKIMDFVKPTNVWDALVKANPGDTFTVEREKNAKGYWDWKEIHRQDGTVAAGAPVAGHSYEDKRQKFIIRQSCLAQAVALSRKPTEPDEINYLEEVGEILSLAEEFEKWVLRETV